MNESQFLDIKKFKFNRQIKINNEFRNKCLMKLSKSAEKDAASRYIIGFIHSCLLSSNYPENWFLIMNYRLIRHKTYAVSSVIT